MIALPVCLQFASDGLDLSGVSSRVSNHTLFEFMHVIEGGGPRANGIELISDANTSRLNLLSDLQADKHKLQTGLSVVVPATGHVLLNRSYKVVGDFDCAIITILNGLEVVLTYHSEDEARNDFGNDRVGDLVTINNDGVRVVVRGRAHEFNTNVGEILSSLEVLAII